jgi:hypothetical protein
MAKTSSADKAQAKKLSNILKGIGVNVSSNKIISTVKNLPSGGSSGSSKTTPTPTPAPAPTPTVTPKATSTSTKPLSQMTVAEAKSAGRLTEYYAGIGLDPSGKPKNTTSGTYAPTPTTPATTTPAAATTTTTTGAVGITKGSTSIVPGKTVTGGSGNTQYYSDGTTSNDYKAGSTTAPTAAPAGALPGIENMSQEDFVKKLTEMGIVSSTPVREEIPEEPLPKPLAAQTYDEFRNEISSYAPTAPEAPKVADMYTEQRQKLGISALEDEINGYDAQKAELLAEMDNFKRQENVGQSASFAAGRVSAGAQIVQDKIDALERSQSIAINKLNTKNSFLENLISFTKDDYSTANSNYQFEFNKNLQLQQMFSTKQDKAVDDARATLTTFNNILANSGMSYNDMSASMKAQINVQEMQAKMPIGTMELYARSKPKSDIVSTQSGTDAAGNDFVTFFSKDADGNVTQEKMYTGGVSTAGGAGGAKLGLADAKKYGLPTSLVGMTESEIGDQLASDVPPAWFEQKIEEEGKFSATREFLQSEWDAFRSSIMTSRAL